MKWLKILTVTALCAVLILTSVPLVISEAPPEDERQNISIERIAQGFAEYQGGEVTEQSYFAIQRLYEEKGYLETDGLNINVDLYAVRTQNEFGVRFVSGIGGKSEKTLVWDYGSDWIEWSVNIPEAGLYEMVFEYFPMEATGVNISRELMINGQVPFKEAHNLIFSRVWQDEGEPKINAAGDEVIPRQVEAPRWRTIPIHDSEGLYSEPLKFFFDEGINVIRMNYLNQPMAIANITVRSPVDVPEYAAVKTEYQNRNLSYARESVSFQAEEKSVIKSDPTIRRLNNGDPSVQPRSIENVRLNALGGTRWQSGGQWITWTFDVPEDGLYNIALRLGQWWGDGLPGYRQIAINGRVPFDELREYKFEFTPDWRTHVLQDASGEPFWFYLERGTHELTMSVRLGPIGEVVLGLREDISLLSELILDITMITGESPDLNFEYDLHIQIPDLMDNLRTLANNLQYSIGILDQVSVRRLPVTNALESVKLQIDRMIADPAIIPARLGDLTGAQTNIGSWLEVINRQPLILDHITLVPPNERIVEKNANLFQQLYTAFRIFISSFFKDYDNVSSLFFAEDASVEVHETIDVWVGMGREAAQLLKEIADSYFTPQTGIAVRMNILPSSQLQSGSSLLLLSKVSGRAPDVALGVSSDTPVEFAIRGSVKDLSEFDDFQTIKERFLPGIMIPFEFQGGVYALPQTMGFTVLFYRRDILDRLGLSLPQTWDDIRRETLPVLHQNKMSFATGNRPNVFGAMLLQSGGSYYSDDMMSSGFDTPEALRAFLDWTQLYSHYGVPVAIDFYNRMRTGVTPIGIGGYELYMRLLVAAPELMGKWNIAPIPGTLLKDGTIDRSAVGGATGQSVIITKQSDQPQESWEFLKWWTSAEAQVNFGREVEALLGPAARWNSANLEAFDSLPWDEAHMQVIKEQLTWNREQPVVPGGYYTGRHLDNAFTRSVMMGISPRDSLEQAVEDINRELRVKQEEFGLGAFRER